MDATRDNDCTAICPSRCGMANTAAAFAVQLWAILGNCVRELRRILHAIYAILAKSHHKRLRGPPRVPGVDL